MGLSLKVRSYTGCIVGGAVECDSRCTTQNSGIMVVDENTGSGSVTDLLIVMRLV
ncbi:uncharacterized protein E6C27_scaffold223G00150 [Cucumis melo var. makuwa]|uniref:Uncharacterized protein n=1 Tax=Cucumis melo var. makuwa TaxID=1194695 RepID=A0A5A7SSA8_CUCMM|nr:uncharacterized protein E6C27_scaffold223G00150 [Cucumis melo var. makuwa]